MTTNAQPRSVPGATAWTPLVAVPPQHTPVSGTPARPAGMVGAGGGPAATAPARSGGGSVMRLDPAELRRVASAMRTRAEELAGFDLDGLALTARQVGDRALASALARSVTQRRAEMTALVANLRTRAADLEAMARESVAADERAASRLRSLNSH